MAADMKLLSVLGTCLGKPGVDEEERHEPVGKTKGVTTVVDVGEKMEEMIFEEGREFPPPVSSVGSMTGGGLVVKEEKDISIEQLNRHLYDLKKLNWMPHDLSRAELVSAGMAMYLSMDLLGAFDIEQTTLRRFLYSIIETSVRGVSYHNYLHYFSVLHATWYLLFVFDLWEKFDKWEMLAILTAAVSHDAGHIGVSNQFLINLRHPLAMRYNDQSVLENYHASFAFELLKKADCNILKNLTSEGYSQVRKLIISAIINTDMANHFSLIEKFNNSFGGLESGSTMEWMEDPALRHLFLNMVVHVADIGNPYKAWQTYLVYADALATEFKNQNELEVRCGLPISGHMVGLGDLRTQARLEIGFIDLFAAPSIKSLGKVHHGLRQCCINVAHNRARWQEVIDTRSNEL